MMRRVVRLEWSILARADRDAIFDYIEADSPQAAIVVDEQIRLQGETLARFPDAFKVKPTFVGRRCSRK